METYLKDVAVTLVMAFLQVAQIMLASGERFAPPVSESKWGVRQSVGIQGPATRTENPGKKVVCRANSEQSYTLYVPSGYAPDRKWPILYAFDPAARGQIPVEHFRRAAEHYGWIVAGSNNSRNGPNKLAVDAFEAIWQDTHERFSIDDRRVYATGFSGGARVAVGLAARCQGCIAGIISSGAGFHSDVAASPNLPFIFFAAVGIDDFNFPELKELESKLEKAGTTHHLEVFSGDHEWLPEKVAFEAIQWMELQSMKAGRRGKDPALIESFWEARLTAARAAEDGGRRYEAYRNYRAISRDFSGLKDIGTIAEKVGLLREDRDVKKLINQEKAEISKQRELENRLTGLLSERRVPENRLAATADFRAAINVLIAQARESQNTPQRRVAARVLRSLVVGTYELAEGDLRAARYASAVSNLEIATEIAPNNPRILFDLACAHALAGKKKPALQILQKAIENGFSDLESIETNRALDSLRQEAVYMELVRGLKKDP